MRQFYEKRHFNIAANLTLNTMVSFIILLIARTARIACPDRQTEKQNDKPSTVTLAHARRGLIIIDPRRACARVTVLVLSVCLCVCFPYSGTSRNQAYKQQYQRLQHDTGMKYKKGFFFKTLRSEVMASFTHLE